MITDVDIRERIKSEIAEQTEIPKETIDENIHLPDLGIDSLQALQLLVMLERTYNISIAEDDLKQFRTINTIVELVNGRMTAAVAVPQ